MLKAGEDFLKNAICCSILNFVNKRLSDGELTDLTIYYIPIMKKAGFDGIEIYFNSPDVSDIKRIKKASRRYNFPVTSVHFPKTILDKARDNSIFHLKQLVRASLSLDCDLSIVHPPWAGTPESSREELKSILHEILPWTQAQNFRFSVETTPINKCHDYFKDIVKEFGKETIYLTLDMEFLATVGLNISQFYETVGLLPQNIHVNDYDGFPVDKQGKRRYPLLGTGNIDHNAEGLTIKQVGYKGLLTLETSLAHLKDPLNELTRSLNFIHEKMAR